MEPRDKRDLPEVVAEILIEQHAMREDIAALRQEVKEQISGLRQEMKEDNAALRQEMKEDNAALRQEMKEGNVALRASLAEMTQTFNGMTNAILDAMNRGTDRYDSTNQRIKQLDTRVAKLENPAADAIG